MKEGLDLTDILYHFFLVVVVDDDDDVDDVVVVVLVVVAVGRHRISQTYPEPSLSQNITFFAT